MRPSVAVMLLPALVLLPRMARGQKVVLQRGTPAAVVEALKAQLLSQQFVLVRADDKKALFTLDRGMVSQQTNAQVRMVHVVLELHVTFKPKKEGLEVSAYEELVGATGSARVEFRQPVRSPAERDNLQLLLESVRTTLESRPPAVDSAGQRDSSAARPGHP